MSNKETSVNLPGGIAQMGCGGSNAYAGRSDAFAFSPIDAVAEPKKAEPVKTASLSSRPSFMARLRAFFARIRKALSAFAVFLAEEE